MNATTKQDAVCCGEPGAWAQKGQPLVVGCALCPNSPTFWRLAANRADGKPYEPMPQPEPDPVA